jgi:hypothetical protein
MHGLCTLIHNLNSFEAAAAASGLGMRQLGSLFGSNAQSVSFIFCTARPRLLIKLAQTAATQQVRRKALVAGKLPVKLVLNLDMTENYSRFFVTNDYALQDRISGSAFCWISIRSQHYTYLAASAPSKSIKTGSSLSKTTC